MVTEVQVEEEGVGITGEEAVAEAATLVQAEEAEGGLVFLVEVESG